MRITQISKYREEILLLLPPALLLTVFVVVPILAVFGISFTEWPIIGVPKFLGVQNYSHLLQDNIFRISMRNTLYYTIILVPSITLLSLGLASMLNAAFPGSNIFKTIYVIPIVAGIVVTSNIWKGLLTTFGPVNQLLTGIGLSPVNFFSPTLAIWSVSLSLLWRNIGYYTIFFLAGMKSIPAEVYDAAAIDGSTGLHTFLKITLPLLKPITLLVVILNTIGSFQIFTVVYIMTGGGPANATISLLNYIYDTGWKFFRMGYASSQAVIFFGVLLLLSIIQKRYIGGETS
ncbi:MAG: sugar ABC transporter permease [Firmicutes bacterium]|nr:sugar ABC transporter permease [Bacillota bacterium]